jgi:hypothetical protein
LHLEAIQKLLAEARFIHLIRDGRDVALSLRNLWFSPGESMEVQAKFWRDTVSTCRAQGMKCRHYLEIHYEQLVAEPRSTLQNICDFIELPFDSHMMRYHEYASTRLKEHGARIRRDGTVLVSVEQRLRQQRLTASIPDTSRIYAWRREMKPEETLRYEAIAGETLRAFGYGLRT